MVNEKIYEVANEKSCVVENEIVYEVGNEIVCVVAFAKIFEEENVKLILFDEVGNAIRKDFFYA